MECQKVRNENSDGVKKGVLEKDVDCKVKFVCNISNSFHMDYSTHRNCTVHQFRVVYIKRTGLLSYKITWEIEIIPNTIPLRIFPFEARLYISLLTEKDKPSLVMNHDSHIAIIPLCSKLNSLLDCCFFTSRPIIDITQLRIIVVNRSIVIISPANNRLLPSTCSIIMRSILRCHNSSGKCQI